MAKYKQYADTIIVDKDELDDIHAAQEDILEYGLIDMDDHALEKKLSIAASLAAVVFAVTRKANWALFVVSFALGLSTTLKEDLIKNVRSANRELNKIRRFMRDNPDYTKVEIELPFMDADNFRLITGKGVVKRVRTRNGWIPM